MSLVPMLINKTDLPKESTDTVEVGLALLANAHMPLKFWDEAFLTATYLINILPTRVLDLKTATEVLLKTKPDYSSLRIFGCACWPNLRPFNSRKVEFR